MSTLHLLRYNNYYNRLVRQESDLSSYQGYQVKYQGKDTDLNVNSAIIEGVNFVDGDYVDTTQVVNWAGDIPDYLLVVEDNVIRSRWFVVGAQKTRGGQLLLSLHRDLVVDYYKQLLNENTSIFVEKAIVPGSNDLVFNHEAITFNQIKTKETLIKDQSQSPWICVFAARENADQELSYTVDLGTSVEIAATLSETEFNEYVQNPTVRGDVQLFGVRVMGRRSGQQIFDSYYVAAYGDNNTSLSSGSVPSGLTGEFQTGLTSETVRAAIVPRIDGIKLNVGSLIPDYNAAKYEEFRSLDNQNIRVIMNDGSTRIYSVSVQFNGLMDSSDAIGKVWSDNIRPAIQSLYRSNVPTSTFSSGVNYASVSWAANQATITFSDITASTDTRTVTIAASRTHLMDAPYDMFCMPYSDELKIQVGNRTITASKELALTFANNISKNSSVYDMQLLPYCPLVGSTILDGTLIMPDSESTSPIYAQVPGQTNEIIGYVLHANKSSFSRSIALDDPIVISDYKIENETDVYRLVSPNYNGVFEFSAAKNGGVSAIQVQCTYKPYNSYIKLFPTWGRLYGSNFSDNDYDARGLICGGDFSLPRVSSAWEEYELRNKNYQLSFDRQIQNLEINNSVQQEREIWGIAANTLQGGLQGASTGGRVGGAWGAVAGAVIGTGASLAGGIRDYQLNEKLRDEAIDYTKDQFGYQLGNIKALPLSLSKVTAYNVDNKYFPFLEYYTCSDVEKQALRDKIKFNGMTVMAIGTLKEYVDNYHGTDPMYFKGKLIRLDGFDGDYHILNALAAEIYKGVFI